MYEGAKLLYGNGSVLWWEGLLGAVILVASVLFLVLHVWLTVVAQRGQHQYTSIAPDEVPEPDACVAVVEGGAFDVGGEIVNCEVGDELERMKSETFADADIEQNATTPHNALPDESSPVDVFADTLSPRAAARDLLGEDFLTTTTHPLSRHNHRFSIASDNPFTSTFGTWRPGTHLPPLSRGDFNLTSTSLPPLRTRAHSLFENSVEMRPIGTSGRSRMSSVCDVDEHKFDDCEAPTAARPDHADARLDDADTLGYFPNGVDKAPAESRSVVEPWFYRYTPQQRSRVPFWVRMLLLPQGYWSKNVARSWYVVVTAFRPSRAVLMGSHGIVRVLLMSVVAAVSPGTPSGCSAVQGTLAGMCFLHGLVLWALVPYRVPLVNALKGFQSLLLGLMACASFIGSDVVQSFLLVLLMCLSVINSVGSQAVMMLEFQLSSHR